jgi:hypothetical protein
LKHDEERKRRLNIGPLPACLILHRLDEERPGVLEVRDHDHRDKRCAKLKPAIVDAHVLNGTSFDRLVSRQGQTILGKNSGFLQYGYHRVA